MSRLSVSISPDDHIQGEPDAACSLVEYGDYECPSCAQIQPVIKRLQRHFGKRLSFVFRNFPLSELHPWAEPAAEAAEFAGSHGKFWEMHDLLFQNQAILSSKWRMALVFPAPSSEPLFKQRDSAPVFAPTLKPVSGVESTEPPRCL